LSSGRSRYRRAGVGAGAGRTSSRITISEVEPVCPARQGRAKATAATKPRRVRGTGRLLAVRERRIHTLEPLKERGSQVTTIVGRTACICQVAWSSLVTSAGSPCNGTCSQGYCPNSRDLRTISLWIHEYRRHGAISRRPFVWGSRRIIPVGTCAIVGAIPCLASTERASMPTIPRRIARAFAVLCGQYGDVTKMAVDREQSRQSLYREAEQVAITGPEASVLESGPLPRRPPQRSDAVRPAVPGSPRAESLGVPQADAGGIAGRTVRAGGSGVRWYPCPAIRRTGAVVRASSVTRRGSTRGVPPAPTLCGG